MCYKHELARYKGIVEEKLFAIVDGCGAPKDLKAPCATASRRAARGSAPQ